MSLIWSSTEMHVDVTSMRKKIPESFSVRKIEHGLSVKVISVDLKSLQYTSVLYWSEFCTIRVNIRTTISVYFTKNPHKPRQVFLGARFHNFFYDFFLKISMDCSSKLSQIYSIFILLIR